MLDVSEKHNEKLNTVVSFTEQDIESINADRVLTTIISPGGKEVKITGDVDIAMQIALHNKEDHIEITPEESRKLRNKISLYVLPLVMLLYCFQFMDKLSNSYASILGMPEDMQMVGNQYSWTGTSFYIGYLACEFGASYLLQKLPVIKTVGAFIIAWGLVIALGSLSDYAGFIAIRTIQGGLESIITPAFTLYTTFWYTKEENFFIVSLWFASNGLGTILGSGVIAHAIYLNENHYALAPWKILFIVVGVLTIFLGILMILHLPDTPAQAWFLNDREKKLVVERIRNNQQGFGNRHFKMNQFKEALTDPQTWLFAIYGLANNIPNGGLTNFGSILLQDDLKYSTGQSLLMGMPSGFVELFGCTFFAYCYRFYPNRMFWATLTAVVALAAECMLAFSTNRNVQLAGYSMYAIGVLGFICVLSSVGANVLGTTKKQTTGAIFLISYCVGNLIGPQTFRSNEAPDYVTAKIIIVVMGAISVVTLIAIWIYYVYENKKRDKRGPVEINIENIEFADMTDKENPKFRYVI